MSLDHLAEQQLTRINVMQPWLGEEEVAAVSEVLRSGWVAQGPRVAQFEAAFAESQQVAHAVALSSCTTALHLALVIAGVGPGDEVVVPSFSFVATTNAPTYVGATPIFADVDPVTGNLTPATIATVVTPRTRAVIAVDQGGVPLDLRANWIYRVTGLRGASECLAASRRALVVLAIAPVWLTTAVLCLWLWPWRSAVGHLAILGLIGVFLAEICLHGFQKIPFTCSYLPGKSQVHLAVLGGIGLLDALALSIKFERQVLEDAGSTVAVVIALAVLAAAARWRRSLSACAPSPTTSR